MYQYKFKEMALMSLSPSIHDTNDICGNVKDFISTLEARGFTIQEGELRKIDILKLCSEGSLNYCFGNNAGYPYACYLLPPAPNQDPSKEQNPPKGYDPDDPNNYPANINSVPPGLTYKLRPDEAIVLIGKTPPQARYFSFRSYLGFVQNKPEKDYSNVFTSGNENTGVYHRVYASLGDPLNHLSMWTDGTPKGATGSAFNSSTILITTADKCVNMQIRDALSVAGYSSDIMNDDNIPMDLVNMGLEKGKDTLIFIMRAAVWAEKDTGDEYFNNLDNFMRVFRITPNIPFANLHPWPVPTLKTRETGTSEYQVVPHAVSDLEYLRNEIMHRHGSTKYKHVDLNTILWIPEGYVGIFQDVDVLAEDRDTVYLRTDTFQLTTDDDFVIVYGVNHEQTGKAIYSNFSFYGVELLNGVCGANSSMLQYQNSAAEYFPKGYENSKYYYVYKIARSSLIDENCVVLPYSTGNPSGKAYGVDNNKDAFIAFRTYIDKNTQVGPAHFELIWDCAILFTKE